MAIAFQFFDGFPRGQVQNRPGTGEIQEFTPVNQRRTGRPHVDFPGAIIEHSLNNVLKLCAPDNGVFAEQNSFILDKLPDWDQFHPCHKVPDPLVLRHTLPKVPVPLRQTDGDVGLDLQPIIERIYAAGGHDDIDYTRPLSPPLDRDDEAWADELLRGAGKR